MTTTVYVELRQHRREVILADRDMTIWELKVSFAAYAGVQAADMKIANSYFTNDQAENESKVVECLRYMKLPNELPLISFKPRGALEQPIVDNNQNFVDGCLLTQGLKALNFPRPGKKLLVLDVDQTLYDMRAFGTSSQQVGVRPHIHTLLECAYDCYEIILWSDTDMSYIEQKAEIMGITTNPNYTILAYFNSEAMPLVNTVEYGIIKTKALERIWEFYPQFNETNSLLCDDRAKNFYYNPYNGLLIKPFDHTVVDIELIRLKRYLDWLKDYSNFSIIRHDVAITSHSE